MTPFVKWVHLNTNKPQAVGESVAAAIVEMKHPESVIHMWHGLHPNKTMMCWLEQRQWKTACSSYFLTSVCPSIEASATKSQQQLHCSQNMKNKISNLSVLSFITKVIIKLSASAIWAVTISDLWQLFQDKSGRHSTLFFWIQISQFYIYYSEYKFLCINTGLNHINIKRPESVEEYLLDRAMENAGWVNSGI